MKLYANNGDTINIGIWGSKDGREGTYIPRQAEKSTEIYSVFIDNEKITVYFNSSKSNVPYYYLKFDKLWHWSRDEIRANSRYRTS